MIVSSKCRFNVLDIGVYMVKKLTWDTVDFLIWWDHRTDNIIHIVYTGHVRISAFQGGGIGYQCWRNMVHL